MTCSGEYFVVQFMFAKDVLTRQVEPLQVPLNLICQVAQAYITGQKITQGFLYLWYTICLCDL